ncbi:MAG: hypothetical protein WBN81_14095, partial [Gammaproteobacteria bacterium]
TEEPTTTTTEEPTTTTTTTSTTSTTSTTAQTTTTTIPPGDTVVIEDCDSGVPNEQDGIFISDLIAACEAAGPKNHGQFVGCVARSLNTTDLNKEQKDAIVGCAGGSSIGK